MMLAGGVNASLPAEVTVIFTQLGALSGRGKVRPFDTGSDGTLLGEGLGVVVLKRLDDALADGDRIYAVLRGVGQASDGRGHGLLAPSLDGETLAIRRAYDSTGVDPATHRPGRGARHRHSARRQDRDRGAEERVRRAPHRAAARSRIGSVKSMISHCIPAAGIAGLIKTVAGAASPHAAADLVRRGQSRARHRRRRRSTSTPRPAPWIARLGSAAPRRQSTRSASAASTSHAIVEEAPAEARAPRALHALAGRARACCRPPRRRRSLAKLERARRRARPARGARRSPTSPPRWRAPIAASRSGSRSSPRIAKSLAKSVEQARARLRDKPAPRWSLRSGAFYGSAPEAGKLAFLFPGEGSQYPDMLGRPRPLLRRSAAVARLLARALRPAARRQPHRHRLPAASEIDDGAAEAPRARACTTWTSAARRCSSAAWRCTSLLRSLGVEPDVMMGHSSGESAALAASGAVPAATPLELAAFMRELNAVYERVLRRGQDPDRRACSRSARCRPRRCRRRSPPPARRSSSRWTTAPTSSCCTARRTRSRALQNVLADAGAICLPLPFDRGYHTPISPTSAPPSSPTTGASSSARRRCRSTPARRRRPFPTSAAARAQARRGAVVAEGALSRDDRADGTPTACGCFVEVGPSGNLTAFVNDIPAGKAQTSRSPATCGAAMASSSC